MLTSFLNEIYFIRKNILKYQEFLILILVMDLEGMKDIHNLVFITSVTIFSFY